MTLKLKMYEKYGLSDLYENPNSIFLFGDNDIKRGKKGQSIIRDLDNAFGIPTKKYPSYDIGAYYSDNEYLYCKTKLDIIFEKLDTILKNKEYESISIPIDGIGTGLARLKEKAPMVNKYLLEKLDNLFGLYLVPEDYLEYKKLDNYKI
jgi:hypothetical protein